MNESSAKLQTSLAVIICTYNPRREVLAKTVEGLTAQTLRSERWQFVIVDNNSDPEVDGSEFTSWHVEGRVLREPIPGLSAARVRGIRDTDADLLLFVDDDNVLAGDYLERVLEIAENNPKLGVIGAARILPVFEVDPDDDVRPFTRMLALRHVHTDVWSNDPSDGHTPWGAGMIVRRRVADEFADRYERDRHQKLLGRKGDALNSGEDDEFSWIACEMGLGKGLFASLKLDHLIDKRRIARDYILRIAEGHAFSRQILRHIHAPDLLRYQDSLDPRPDGRPLLRRAYARLRMSPGFAGKLFRLFPKTTFREKVELFLRAGRKRAEREICTLENEE